TAYDPRSHCGRQHGVCGRSLAPGRAARSLSDEAHQSFAELFDRGSEHQSGRELLLAACVAPRLAFIITSRGRTSTPTPMRWRGAKTIAASAMANFFDRCRCGLEASG